VRFVRTAKEEISYLKRDYDRVEEARKKLESDPDDPQANVTVGRYLCLAKGEFADALPYLAKGDGAELAELAKLEASKPTDVGERARLADGWWDLAEEEKDPVQRWTRLRAANWYEKALPSLRGLQKTRAEQRLKEAQALADAAGMLRWGKSLEQMILGRWRVTWRYVSFPSTSTRTEMLDFDAAKTFSRDAFRLGTWEVQGSEVVVSHGSYTDRYKMVAPNQLMAVRFRSGQPYMQGAGQRYNSTP
jgi:hypothetical protein